MEKIEFYLTQIYQDSIEYLNCQLGFTWLRIVLLIETAYPRQLPCGDRFARNQSGY